MNFKKLFRRKNPIYDKPIVSLIGTAVRTNLWKEFYKSLKNNSTPFEVVFVGNKTPHFRLPSNFRFVYSEVKPVQCVEIAARNAHGDLLMVTADDCVFSKNAIDKMLDLFYRINNDDAIISAQWVKGGSPVDKSKYHFFIGKMETPILAVSPLLKKSLWRKLGGLDRRFIASCADCDMAMRVYEVGGKVTIADNVFYRERKEKSGGINLYPEFGYSYDRPLLESLWVRGGVVVKKRLSKIQPFANKNLLTKTQGPVGRWK